MPSLPPTPLDFQEYATSTPPAQLWPDEEDTTRDNYLAGVVDTLRWMNNTGPSARFGWFSDAVNAWAEAAQEVPPVEDAGEPS